MVQPRRTHFVLISAPRSGTNHLLSLTGQHRNAHCFYELFHEKPNERTGFFGGKYADDEDGGAFADRVYGWSYSRSIRAVGFKLFYQHADRGPAQTVWQYLASRPEIKVIDLVRENELETYVSLQIALRTKAWIRHYRLPESEVAQCPPFEVVADDFEAYVRKMRKLRLRALSRIANNDRLSVTYSDLAVRQTAVMKRVFRFLGLPRYPWVWGLKNHLVKQQRVPLTVQISNYGALRERFAGTEFSQFFTQG